MTTPFEEFRNFGFKTYEAFSTNSDQISSFIETYSSEKQEFYTDLKNLSNSPNVKKIVRPIVSYAPPKGIFDTISWIIYRISNAVKLIFTDNSDWQVAKKKLIALEFSFLRNGTNNSDVINKLAELILYSSFDAKLENNDFHNFFTLLASKANTYIKSIPTPATFGAYLKVTDKYFEDEPPCEKSTLEAVLAFEKVYNAATFKAKSEAIKQGKIKLYAYTPNSHN